MVMRLMGMTLAIATSLVFVATVALAGDSRDEGGIVGTGRTQSLDRPEILERPEVPERIERSETLERPDRPDLSEPPDLSELPSGGGGDTRPGTIEPQPTPASPR